LSRVLERVELAELDEFQLIEVLTAAHRQIAHAQARLVDVLGEVARRRPDPIGVGGAHTREADPVFSEFAADEVAAALSMAPNGAANLLSFAVKLSGRLPGTLAALRAGRIDWFKSRVIAEETDVLVDGLRGPRDPGDSSDDLMRAVDPDSIAELEARVLGRAGQQTPGALREACRRAVLRADRGAAERRHKAARAERKVAVYPLPDGIAELRWTDTVDRVLGLSAALDGLARSARADESQRRAEQRQSGAPLDARRSMDQLRADALAEVGARLLADPRLPENQGARPNINVVVPLGILLDLDGGQQQDDQQTGDPQPSDPQPSDVQRSPLQPSDPAELLGYGPIPDSLARRLAADGTWRRWLTDPVSGELLDVGRARYRPTAAIREFVLARDRTCQGGNGCRMPARRCDIDHTIDWGHGGTTSVATTAALCRHTHRAKHEGGWTVVRDGPELRWNTPSGHQYHRSPDPLPGATPPLPLTAKQLERVRHHARQLGIDASTLAGTGQPAAVQELQRSSDRLGDASPSEDIPPF
jgi:hypothetical protein